MLITTLNTVVEGMLVEEELAGEASAKTTGNWKGNYHNMNKKNNRSTNKEVHAPDRYIEYTPIGTTLSQSGGSIIKAGFTQASSPQTSTQLQALKSPSSQRFGYRSSDPHAMKLTRILLQVFKPSQVLRDLAIDLQASTPLRSHYCLSAQCDVWTLLAPYTMGHFDIVGSQHNEITAGSCHNRTFCHHLLLAQWDIIGRHHHESWRTPNLEALSGQVRFHVIGHHYGESW
ncbi:hypothetical protein Cgig2_027244 [Carnegiea gigantea]|uniref:Uncharacterized protein n=1 Tax=Carnegiea gigantea TaxID=171969 RepID=A0A9Q1K1F9_9CARY|nr:hypothetical protein Cgig2_027244 [Carnegiea gigantea]